MCGHFPPSPKAGPGSVSLVTCAVGAGADRPVRPMGAQWGSLYVPLCCALSSEGSPICALWLWAVGTLPTPSPPTPRGLGASRAFCCGCGGGSSVQTPPQLAR